ncbi:MAG: metallophosphoesterase, partial [Acidobacteriota bacterium]|nr:metallophosphoesterase [Acidobacteriota bacterium]
MLQVLCLLGWFYIAWRMVSGLGIRKPYNICLFAVFLALAMSGFFRRSENPIMSALSPLWYVCMGACGIAFIFFVVNDIVNISNLFFRIKRFRYYSTLIALILSVIACAWSLLNVAFIINIKEVKINIPDLPVESFRIAQLSDLHINQTTHPEAIKKMLSKIELLEPDLIVLTGDIIDADINANDKFREYGFEMLKAPYGVFAVTGNHERRRQDVYFEMLDKLGITALKNESVLLGNGIAIAGINDADW